MDRSFAQLDDLYREVVLDHYRSPRGRESLTTPDLRHEGFNPVCGDETQLALEMTDGQVKNVQIKTRGCAISVASGSMLAELLPGMTIKQIEELTEQFREMLQNGVVADESDLGDLETLQGVSKFPVRVKCAMLAWMTLREALRAWREDETAPEQATSTEEANR